MFAKFYRHFLAPKIHLAVAAATARSRGLRAFRVLGGNMEPTLQLGEVALYSRESAETLCCGDVVVVQHPEYYGGDCVPLRIVGLAGDVIAIETGQLWVNGQTKAEPYLFGSAAESDLSRQFTSTAVPEGFAFLLGDCRDNSNDSRFLGPIPLRAIVGRVRQVHPLESPQASRAVR